MSPWRIGPNSVAQGPILTLQLWNRQIRCFNQTHSDLSFSLHLQPLHPSSNRVQYARDFRLHSLIGRRFQSSSSKSDSQSVDVDNIENEAIKSFRVFIVSPEGKLGDPVSLMNALESRAKDEKGKFLEVLRQVQPASPANMFPICKYLNLKTLREKELAQQRAAKALQAIKRQNKKLEMNWTIGNNDLGHKMDRLKEFLTSGRAVEVTLGSQRKKGWQRKRPQSQEDAERLIQNVKKAALEVRGVKESKAMTGEIGGLVILNFEGQRVTQEVHSG